jgi:hypothetical protein
MTSALNGTDELERRLTARLHDHSRLAPDGDGWDAILDRIEHRGRARHRRRAAATGVVAVTIVGSLVVLAGNDGTRVSTTPAPPAAPAATAGGLPRLVLDVPGFDLVHASATGPMEPGPDLGRLLVYGMPGNGVLDPGPVVFARLVPAGAPYGIGDGPGVIEVDVAGRSGRLLPSSAAAQSLGWPREDGSIVHLIAVGFVYDELLAAGQAIESALAAGQAPPASLAGGIELRRDTSSATSSATSPMAEGEVSYGAGDRQVKLRVISGGTHQLDDLVRDRLASSTGWRPADVGGRPAVLSAYAPVADEEPSRTLMWALDDGVVAELRGHGLTEAELEAAAASIRPVGEAEWADLLLQSEVLQSLPVPGEAARDASHVAMNIDMCQARNTWLRARAFGDEEVAAAAAASLGALLEQGRETGLGKTGDILVVAQRLLDAMAVGDVAAVSSIPEGGACS